MVELDRATVERKLALLLGYVGELRPLVGVSGPPVGGNVVRRAIERLVQLVVEVAIDVNHLLAVGAGQAPPASGRESFETVERSGAVPPDLVRRFKASYVGLRNRIVHEYETLDDVLVLRAARRLVSDGLAYAAAVRAHLSRSGGAGEACEPRVRYRKTSAKPVRSGPVRKRTT